MQRRAAGSRPRPRGAAVGAERRALRRQAAVRDWEGGFCPSPVRCHTGCAWQTSLPKVWAGSLVNPAAIALRPPHPQSQLDALGRPKRKARPRTQHTPLCACIRVAEAAWQGITDSLIAYRIRRHDTRPRSAGRYGGKQILGLYCSVDATAHVHIPAYSAGDTPGTWIVRSLRLRRKPERQHLHGDDDHTAMMTIPQHSCAVVVVVGGEPSCSLQSFLVRPLGHRT